MTARPDYAPRALHQSLRFTLFNEMTAAAAGKDHLIKGIFARGETSAWVAPPGGMKSALMASAAIAIASGADWFGRKNKAGPTGVVYFALERADLVKRRLQAHRDRAGLASLPIAVVSDTFELMKPGSDARVVATIRAIEAAMNFSVGWVAFDTFAKLLAAGGGDEDKARDQGAVFSNIQRIKDQTKAHVAIVGHTGKDESRGARGSNAILGDADIMVTIGGDTIRTATVTKANDGPEGALFSFRSDIHEFGTDDDGDPITVNVVSDEDVSFQSETKSGRAGKWPKGLKLVHEAMVAASLEHGTDHRVGGDGPTVKAFPVAKARAVHAQRYVSNGDGERADAERKAWSRNFKSARDADLFGGEVVSGQEMIWLIAEAR